MLSKVKPILDKRGAMAELSNLPTNKKIWIDLDNSPHVVFFRPILRELEKKGYQTFVTARDCFQVCGLAELHGLKYVRIGKHYGKNKLLKIVGTLYRGLQLLSPCLGERPCVAVSHGSRSQLIAAKLLGMHSVMISDYEYTKGYRLLRPYLLIIPELLMKGIAANDAEHAEQYPGIKEDVYIPEFVPDDAILEELKINRDNILITVRPPATEAHYHSPESERMFNEVVDFFGSKENLQMVMLPRNEKKQGDLIRSKWGKWCDEGKIIIPKRVVNGLNLIWHSDLVVSGGGTMNREAAALGVPVYSIFRGKVGAVDRYLSEKGRLILIENQDQLYSKILLARRNKSFNPASSDNRALQKIVSHIVNIIEGQ
jgi:predicted glycosyltransferase